MTKTKTKKKVQPRRTEEEVLKFLLEIIKEKKRLNKSELIKKSKITQSVRLNRLLNILQERGSISIAKVETFLGKKKVTQAVTIQYIREGKDGAKKSG